MHRLTVPLYLALIAVGIAAPIYALSVLFDVTVPGAVAVAEAEPAAQNAPTQNAVAANAPATPQKPIWIAPTRQYNYTPPPLPKIEPAATERAAPAKKENTKAKEAKRPERKPAQEAGQPRATPEALQAFAAEVVPERAINRD